MRLEAVLGDLTTDDADAVVNAANATLLGGGGVDGALHAAAGPTLLAECREVRRTLYPEGLPAGAAVATGGGRLPARHVIHTVGPQHWEHPDGGPDILASCHTSALRAADELDLAVVAFPAISCGAYGWSHVDAAPIAVAAVRRFAAANPDSSVALVRFVLTSPEALASFSAAIAGSGVAGASPG